MPLLHKERTETVAETAKKGETVRAHATLLAETQCVCVCVCACVCVVVAGCGECGGDSGERGDSQESWLPHPCPQRLCPCTSLRVDWRCEPLHHFSVHVCACIMMHT